MTSLLFFPSRRTAAALATTLAFTIASSFADTYTENAQPTVFRAPSGATLQDLVTQGAGTRMIWHPKKGAFRAGTISGTTVTQWDENWIGYQSFAAGWNTIASAPYATAFGSGTTASSYMAASAATAPPVASPRPR